MAGWFFFGKYIIKFFVWLWIIGSAIGVLMGLYGIFATRFDGGSIVAFFVISLFLAAGLGARKLVSKLDSKER